MTKDEIIEMARKAHGPLTGTWWDMDIASLERFAKLVAQHERERLTDAAMKAAEKAIDVAMALEREECLQICQDVVKYFPSSGFVGSFIASKIKERSTE